MKYLHNNILYKFCILGIMLMVLLPEVFSQRPNIIFIITDDMGYGDLSVYGRKDYQTPNLDKLASQGIRFTHAYAAAPLCTPTRAALMTGRYPARTPVGLIEPLTGSEKDIESGLTPAIPSLPASLGAGGYETALIGKWHLGALDDHSPIKNGFQYFYGFRSGACDYISHKNQNHTYDFYENDSSIYHEGYLTDLFTRKAISFLKKEHTKPFFLMLSYNAPHWPWQGPEDKSYPDTGNFRNGGSAGIYASMMKALDKSIGLIMQTLDESKLSESTLVIFTNDNGGERYSDNGGLSKGKGDLWEGGIRVPAIIRWPGKFKPGTETDQVAVTMDWTSTILAVAECNPDPGFPLDGINLMPVISGNQNTKERTLYWRSFQRSKQKAMRMGKWKYLQDENGDYLFNLSNDNEEKKNLRLINTVIFERLKFMYADWEKTVLKPVPL